MNLYQINAEKNFKKTHISRQTGQDAVGDALRDDGEADGEAGDNVTEQVGARVLRPPREHRQRAVQGLARAEPAGAILKQRDTARGRWCSGQQLLVYYDN